MITNKSKTLTTSIRLLNEKLHFEGNIDGNEPISIDYTPPFGDNLGYTSLELFLLSISSCTGSAILFLLRKCLIRELILRWSLLSNRAMNRNDSNL